jgi:DNA sulfur modification protein DndD
MPVIKKLILNNFYNYFGENLYDFKKGMNIVIADNNGGKSKLFNSFLWVLSDVVFDSDNREYVHLNNPNNQFKLISDKAKINATVGEMVTTSVTLRFENDLATDDLGPSIYTITKSIIAEKLKVSNPTSLDSWNVQIGKSKYIHKLGVNTKEIVDETEQKKVPKFLLPESLKTYYMFQGEEISKLVGKELTNAIRKITHINKFDYMENYLKDILEKAERALNSRIKEASKKQSEAEESANELDRYKGIISNLSGQLIEKKEKMEDKQEKFDSLREKYTEAALQYDLIKKIAKKETDLKAIIDKLEELEKNYNQNFFSNRWILEGVENKIDDFIELRDKYLKNKAQSESNEFVSPLPYNIPDVPSLEKMITDMHCAVCNRSLANDKEALEYLRKLRDRNEHKTTSNTKISHVRIFLDELYKNSNNIPKEDELKETKKRIKEKIRQLNKDIHELTNEINDHKEEQKQKDEDAKKVLDDYNKCSSDLNRLISEIAILDQKLAGAKRDHEREQKKFNSLGSFNSIEPGYQKKVDILEDLLYSFTATKKQYFDQQAESLTEIINKNYRNLTKGNQTNPGNVEIEVNDNFVFRSKMKNHEGGVLSGQGSAFQRMKQLALLMGIVQIGKSQYYPLIADAPVSEMSSILTKNFFFCIRETFEQSIILVKDLIDDETNNNELKLNKLGEDIKGSSYLEALIYINNAKGKEQHERETVIKQISQSSFMEN